MIGLATSRRRGWALIRETLVGQRWGIATGVGAGLVWTAAKVCTPLLVRQAMDRGIAGRDLRALVQWSGLVAAVGVVSAIFTGTRRYLAFREARLAEARLRDRMYAHVQRLHFAFHDRARAGQLMSRANTDLQQIQSFLVMIPLTIANLVIVVASTVALLATDPVLTALALGPLPLVNVLGRRFSERLHPAALGIQEESAQLAAVVDEAISGVRVIKGFGMQDVLRRRLRIEAGDVFGQAMQAARVRSIFLPAIELLPNVGLIAVLAFGGHRVLAGEMTIGSLVMFNFFVVLLVNPLRTLGMIIATAERAVASAGRAAELLETAPSIVDAPSPRSLPEGPGPLGEIRFEGVTFRYRAGEDVTVLDALDLVIPAGQSISLVGATGSGKSTIGRLVPRFYDVDAGRVLLDGVDVREVAVRDLRSQVGIVFDDTFLFNDTLANNIAFADPEASAGKVERAARLAGAHDFISRLPNGYATEVGERGLALSGGQRQRIAIARAILADPRVLILDDATSSVDPVKEHEIRSALSEVMKGRTTIIIAHRPATIALASRVVLLDGGRIMADGTHDSLLVSSEAYRRLLAAENAPTGMSA
jgi:ATP-binding cassette subfamily B protein